MSSRAGVSRNSNKWRSLVFFGCHTPFDVIIRLPHMLNSAIWKTLGAGRGRPPTLSFVAGLRHAMKRGEYVPMHAHRDVEIVYHPTGCGVTRLGHAPWEFEKGSVVVYAPGEKHDQRMTAGGEDLCVQVTVPVRMRAALRHGFYVPRVDRSWLVEDLRHLSCSRSVPGGSAQRILDLQAGAVLLALIEAASDDMPVSPALRQVEKAERFIDEHFPSIDSLQEVAAHVGISHDHLRHRFKAARGRSLVRHLNEVRVARARLLLSNSPLPLKQIATLCGFRDEYYFSAAFRKLTAESPGGYRTRAALERS